MIPRHITSGVLAAIAGAAMAAAVSSSPSFAFTSIIGVRHRAGSSRPTSSKFTITAATIITILIIITITILIITTTIILITIITTAIPTTTSTTRLITTAPTTIIIIIIHSISVTCVPLLVGRLRTRVLLGNN